MALNFSEGVVEDFKEHPVWKELARRIALIAAEADRNIEQPDPFLHGTAVGARQVTRTILELPSRFLAELKSAGRPISTRPE